MAEFDDREFAEKFGHLPPEHVELMWHDATNIYLVVALISILVIIYVKRHRRNLQRLLPAQLVNMFRTRDTLYMDTTEKDEELKRVRLRQQLDMYYQSRKWEQNQNKKDVNTDNKQSVTVEMET
ncbi:small integral membrane protein 19-like [Ptychodera flava]|uniref:small integral membrane protein 19-like n=1 Tax=Ptychodera flava TaxID=63121 RepID=UPI00396A5531